MLTLVLIFCVLLASVLILGAMRKVLGREEEQVMMHVGDSSIVEKKSSLIHRVDVVEKWGKTLTAITALYGLILLLWYLYQGWQSSSQIVH
jgi:hypothetical protein